MQELSLITDESTDAIQLADQMINHAINRHASDIHIEPFEHHCRIRYRQNGILYQISEIPNQLAQRLSTRLKVLAKLDISEKRLPQDGRFQQPTMDFRISTCPTLFGEKIVLRLLNNQQSTFQINSLGLTEPQKNKLLNTLAKPQGMILVTGPTGSGKTVTLYTALNLLNNVDKNISTVEDPIEIKLPGINQVNIQPKIGLTFSTILKTFLRQDPDIIMVGEIRDRETAEIAIQAAQTGHLVLSSLHTNSAIDVINRINSMNIPSYHLANAISLIIAQRLVRLLCEQCKQPDVAPLNNYYRAIGCTECLDGYQGRIGVYEFLTITDALSYQILQGADKNQLFKIARNEGFITLHENALALAKRGMTSLAEINRVIK